MSACVRFFRLVNQPLGQGEKSMEIKSFNYKKNLFAFRLHDWKEPLNGAKMDEHMGEMIRKGWKVVGQVSSSKDTITVTYSKD
jgi:hypothetical protein